MCCFGKSEACWMGSHFVVVCCPRFARHIVLVVTWVTWGGRGEGAPVFCCDSTSLNSDKWQDLGNLVASCHISQTGQTRNGYKWFILPGCLLDGWTNGRTKATEPWLPPHHHHPMSKCVCVCVCGWTGGWQCRTFCSSIWFTWGKTVRHLHWKERGKCYQTQFELLSGRFQPRSHLTFGVFFQTKQSKYFTHSQHNK